MVLFLQLDLLTRSFDTEFVVSYTNIYCLWVAFKLWWSRCVFRWASHSRCHMLGICRVDIQYLGHQACARLGHVLARVGRAYIILTFRLLNGFIVVLQWLIHVFVCLLASGPLLWRRDTVAP